MRNFRPFISVCLLLILSMYIVGCSMFSENKAYTVLAVGGVCDSNGAEYASEYDIWSSDNLNYHNDPSAPTTYTVTFNGKEYSGTYSDSSVIMPDTYVSHQYDGDKVSFDINADTGELTSIWFARETPKYSTMIESECREIADDIAKQYISLEEYEISASERPTYENMLYSYTYRRVIDGYITSDRLTITVDGCGNISSFGSSSLGAFESVERVSIDSEKALASINEKIKSIYPDGMEGREQDINYDCLVRLDDGSYGALYDVSIEWERPYEDVYIGECSHINLLVLLPKRAVK